jgi:hypothetical protein
MEGLRKMAFAGGDPVALGSAARTLSTLGSDLATDAVEVRRPARSIAAAAPGRVGVLAENAVNAAGGAVGAAAVLVTAMGDGSSTAGEQLTLATGGPVAR